MSPGGLAQGARIRERRVWLGIPIDAERPALDQIRLEAGEEPPHGWAVEHARLWWRLVDRMDPGRSWASQIAGPWSAQEVRDAWMTAAEVDDGR